MLGYKILGEIKNYFRAISKFTLQSLYKTFEIIREHNFEKKLNIQTDGGCYFKDDFSLYRDGEVYAVTPYGVLEEIINHIKLKPEDIFIDFGSGKGRVVFFLALQRLKKVIGIELNKELIDISHRNLNKLRFNKTPIEFIQADAAKYRIRDENIFFMFNPFGPQTFQVVIDNIKNSLVDNPRQIYIIYFNPKYSNILDSQNWLTLDREIDKINCMIWRNKF